MGPAVIKSGIIPLLGGISPTFPVKSNTHKKKTSLSFRRHIARHMAPKCKANEAAGGGKPPCRAVPDPLSFRDPGTPPFSLACRSSQANFGARCTSSDEAAPYKLLLSMAPYWLTTDGHRGLDQWTNVKLSRTGRLLLCLTLQDPASLVESPVSGPRSKGTIHRYNVASTV